MNINKQSNDLLINRLANFGSLVIVIIFAAVIALKVGAYAGGADSSGYLNAARLISRCEWSPQLRSVPGVNVNALPEETFVPLGFNRDSHPNRLTPFYPFGLPISVAAIAWITGWTLAPNLCMCLYAVGSVILLYYFLSVFGLGPKFRFLGLLIFAGSPLTLFMSLPLMSDIPTLFWVLLAFISAGQFDRSQKWSVVSGLSLGCAVLARPTSILILPSLLIFARFKPRVLTGMLIGGLVPCLALGLLNTLFYHSACATGNGILISLFSFDNLLITCESYIKWIPVELTPVVFLLLLFPLVGSRTMPRRHILALSVSAILFLGFYGLYKCTHDSWWFLRYILPIYPILLLFALMPIQVFHEKNRRIGLLLYLLVTISVIPWLLQWNSSLGSLSIGRDEGAYMDIGLYVKNSMPKGAVVVTMQDSGCIYYYSDKIIVRWDKIDGSDFIKIARQCEKQGRPIYMCLHPFEEEDALKKFSKFQWKEVTRLGPTHVWVLCGQGNSPSH